MLFFNKQSCFLYSYNLRDGIKKFSPGHDKNIKTDALSFQTCQIRDDRLFALSNITCDCYMLILNFDGRNYKRTKLPKAKKHRAAPCFVNVDDKELLIIGGFVVANGTWLGSVSVFMIAE